MDAKPLNLPFGNGFVAPGTGFLLNNEMDDFSIKPGVPNALAWSVTMPCD